MKYLGVKREGKGIVAWQFLSTQLEEYARADHTHTNFNNLSIGNRLSFGDFGLQYDGGEYPSLAWNHSETGNIMTARKFFVDFWKNFDIHGNTMKGLPTPTADDHAASKAYVDQKVQEASGVDLEAYAKTETIEALQEEIQQLKAKIETLESNAGKVKNDRTNRYLDVWVGPEAIKPDSTNKLVFVEKE